MRYYAAYNQRGFANTWEVHIFNSKENRDEFVKFNHGGINKYNNYTKCKAITRKEATKYATNWNLTQNKENRPDTFKGEYWGIEDYDACDITGFIGQLVVCDNDAPFEHFYK